MKKKSTYQGDIVNYIGVFAIIIVVNYICSFAFGRFDMTADQRYSLSNSTQELLEDEERFSDAVFFKIYLDGDLPADFKRMRNAIKEKLDEFRVFAGDRVQYEFVDPNGDEDEEQNFKFQKGLFDDGLRFTKVSIQTNNGSEERTLWPGALVEYGGSTVDHIQFLSKSMVYDSDDTRSMADGVINSLEYKLVDVIRRVTTKQKKTIGFLQGHGELNEYQTFSARQGLSVHYSVESVAIDGQVNALDPYDALVIAKPSERFNEKDKFIIDQYIMNGGRVMWFVDPMNPNLDSLYTTAITYAMPYDLNIEKDMLYKYGVRLNSNILLDESCGPVYVPFLDNVFPWYFTPKLQPQDHVITGNLDPIRGNYASTIDIVNASDTAVTKTVILASTSDAIFYKSPARISFELTDKSFKPNFNAPNQGDYPVAVLLEGNFSSPFENRVSDAFLSSPDFQTKFRSEHNKMLVVSDGDIIQNLVDLRKNGDQLEPMPLPLDYEHFMAGQNNVPPKLYSNLDFILNSMDYLLGDESLLDLRSKTIAFRMLNQEKVNKERTYWSFINIFIPLLAILLLALVQFLVRRMKYAK